MMLLLALTQSGKRRFTSLEKGCERVLRVGRVALIEFSKVIPLRISQRLRAALEFPKGKFEPSIAIAILLLKRRFKPPKFRLLQSSEA